MQRTLINEKVKKEVTTKPITKSISGIPFYSSRDELPSFKEFLSQAKYEVNILGIELDLVSIHGLNAIKNALQRGIHFKVLALNPHSKLTNYVEIAFSVKDVKARTITSLKTFCELKRSFKSLEIRTYDLLPIHSIIVLDPDSDDAKILVEFYKYGTSSALWSSIMISKKDNKTLFEKFWKSFSFVMDNSEEYSCE